MEEESSGYLFWRCQRDRDIWSMSALFRESLVQHFGSFMDMLWYVALLQRALEYLGENQACLEVSVSPKQSAVNVKWTPPSPTRYKINVDGAMSKEQQIAGVGILIRDDEGHLIGACNKKIEAPLGAIEAEAKAAELGLQFVKDMSIQDFTLESNSLMLVNALKDLSPPHSSIAALV
ncbi:uncharacterized protein LOC142639542 [Castanea sativa]|uniref:uncharacterized protein LOC142639542 n=1 Tax=Castanea sativa TaxID=21020 RepID=UPI003F64C0A5